MTKNQKGKKKNRTSGAVSTRRRKPSGSGNTKSTNPTPSRGRSNPATGGDSGERLIHEVWGFLLIAFGLFLFAGVAFDSGGIVGLKSGELLKGCFGVLSMIFPFFVIISGVLLIIKRGKSIAVKRIIILLFIFFFMSLINSGRFIDLNNDKYALADYYDLSIKLESAGIVPMAVGELIVSIVGKVGLYIFSITGIVILFLLLRNKPISDSFRGIEDHIAEKKSDRAMRKEIKRAEAKEKKEKERELAGELEKNKEIELELSMERLRKERQAAADTLRSGQLIGVDYDFTTGKDLDSSYLSNSGRRLRYTSDEDIFGKSDLTSDSYNTSEASSTAKIDSSDDLTQSQGTDEVLHSAYTPNNEMDSKQSIGDDTKKEKIISNKEAKEAVLSDNDWNKAKTVGRYKMPPINLLKPPEPANKVDNRQLRVMATRLEDTLASFNVDAKVINVTQGPAITRYEIQPNVGVKVSKIVSLADDIALNLRARSIRIEAPIPGKAAVGIEVENGSIHMVRVSELIGSREFKSAKSKITFGVGKDISGNPIVADLKSMPHLLIAGSTGSGKSVCINSLIASVLYKAKPDEVKLILVDPKVVELGNYNGIPHLLIPVVTEPAKAAAALNWAVVEMNERYNKFAKTGVRDLESYNDALLREGSHEEKMPQILIIIDELADLMMAAPSQVEESICRLAQKARAAGMHMVVATQRPSVDVITGLIKANIPSRIAFAVSSQFDSRTILDMSGAEKLVGNGDMLYNPLGMGKPKRVQGCFISDEEVNNIITYIKSQVEEVEYSGEVIKTIENDNLTSGKNKNDDEDELLQDAIETVVNAGQASVSMLQRRFRIGYNRAARIVDMMEARGIVGPQDGSKPRQVLISEDEFNQIELNGDTIEKEGK
ncbi:MAG: DNA translocase FtsK [Clostridiales bacterium]|nr:DNA translocase FtsK [Clostridiales bacterium]MDD7347093.1 DNA translocase FtsK [Clostridiales bacterium]MDY4060579.1 DNA translocase FtsK [Anaerovoracaceae bacterium]